MLSVDNNRSNGNGKRGDSLTNVVREEKGEIFTMVSKEEMYIFKPRSKAVEDMINEEIREITMRILESGKLPIEEVAMYVGLSTEEVKKISEGVF